MSSNEKTQRFENLFRSAGLKFKEVNAFGSQVIVTCWSEDAARQIAKVLRLATFKIRGVVESIDYNKDQSECTTLHPSFHKVWRVGAYA